MKLLGHWTSKVVILLVLACNCLADVTQLNNDNLNDMLKTKMMMVNFYADWCRFSRMLEPVFKDAAAKAAEEFGDVDVKFARADCDKEQALCKKYSVSKYPTIKLLRDGVPMKKEYRGQRTAEAITQYIRDQLKSPVTEVKNLDEIYELNRDKRTIVGYFENKQNVQYANFDLIANLLKDDCQFYAAIGEISKPERSSGDNVVFKPDKESEPEMVFLGSLANKELLQAWIQDKCVPLVREITFQNGEELTEEGLPFMILFHTKEDTESLEKYTKEVSRLVSFKSQINFLVADCQTFSHPLHHLGKSVQDCPLLAIDSFRHMYMFPDFKDVNEPGKLKQFILDLQSGKLHREFHHGPDKPEGQKDAPKSPAQLKQDRMLMLGNNQDLVQYQAVVVIKNGFVEVQMVPVGGPPKPEVPAIGSDQGQDEKEQMPTEARAKLAEANKQKLERVNRSIQEAEENAEGDGGDKEEVQGGGEEEATTIKSVFANLQPSEHRYTLLNKDEL